MMDRSEKLIFAVLRALGERLPGCDVMAFPVYSSGGTPTGSIVIRVRFGNRQEVSEHIAGTDDDMIASQKAIAPALRLLERP
jgi:hypothetical protein